MLRTFSARLYAEAREELSGGLSVRVILERARIIAPRQL
jgi:hypothetical protein